MFKEILENVRTRHPLIHNITNYVTVNDCANMLLACGASPIMADDLEEAEDITSICGGLTINIGTLNQRTIPAMIAAGKKANELEHRRCEVRHPGRVYRYRNAGSAGTVRRKRRPGSSCTLGESHCHDQKQYTGCGQKRSAAGGG
ncbi:hydroxyethylthiazole kinase [uncultured Faecalibaculum sp.]|uniref:hydroxyethylthiazole kinase n=1 Tax=uncultured Faecalibaculum sp. TaxID=1729681 RepID=UPI00260A7B41|nr:hydroxyethylthiazole kinase [uncultured Faecalibaculum sp.]